MSFNPDSIVMDAVKNLSDKYRLPPATVRALLEEFVKAVHETAFKGTMTDALKGVYFSLGPEIAWHFWGLIFRSLEGGGQYLEHERNMWYETAVRFDSQMKRFAPILDRWSQEKAHELEQDELDKKDQKKQKP